MVRKYNYKFNHKINQIKKYSFNKKSIQTNLMSILIVKIYRKVLIETIRN